MRFRTFHVQQQGATVTVQACWDVRWPCESVFSILLDFERMPTWMPALERSVLLNRSDRHMEVRQVGRLLGIPLVVDLEVRWRPPSEITFRRLRGNLDRFEGAWRLNDQTSGCEICYQLVATYGPARWAFWLRPVLQRAIRTQLEALDDYLHRVLSDA